MSGTDATPTVSIDTARLRLGELVPGLQAPWSDVDMGSAPEPLQNRMLSRSQIETRVRDAGLDALPVKLPSSLRVARKGQRLAEPALRRLVHETIAAALPIGVTLQRLVLHGSVVLPRGQVVADAPDFSRARSGEQSVLMRVYAQSAAEPEASGGIMVPVLLRLDVPAALHKKVVVRGQRVQIIVDQGAVHVESGGIAQQSGEVGAWIPVMPQSGIRMVQGRVRDDHTVELLP